MWSVYQITSQEKNVLRFIHCSSLNEPCQFMETYLLKMSPSWDCDSMLLGFWKAAAVDVDHSCFLWISSYIWWFVYRLRWLSGSYHCFPAWGYDIYFWCVFGVSWSSPYYVGSFWVLCFPLAVQRQEVRRTDFSKLPWFLDVYVNVLSSCPRCPPAMCPRLSQKGSCFTTT